MTIQLALDAWNIAAEKCGWPQEVRRLSPERSLSIEERLEFWSMPEPNSGCRLWLGHGARYGRIRWGGKIWLAHRLVWRLTKGEISDDVKICHKCDVGYCIEINHLFEGTQADNVADMIAKGRRKILAGEANGCARLREDDIRRIRNSPDRSNASLAREYGVVHQLISMIRLNQIWKNVQ